MEEKNRNFSLASFKKASSAMVTKNESTYGGYNNWGGSRLLQEKIKDYSLNQIEEIINSGSLVEQQKLSRNYFYKDGFYKQIIIYYATLLKYVGILVPELNLGQSLSTKSNKSKYNKAMNFINNFNIQNFCTNCALRALIDGSYYGIIYKNNTGNFTILDLPSGYACSRFKDIQGRDMVEFNISYFDKILKKEDRDSALLAYPNFVSRQYSKWKKGKLKDPWIIIPADFSICFSFFDGRPLLLNIIPSTIKYNTAVDTEIERDLDEIRKILVQKVPHLQDGRLVFEPEEAEEMHSAAVGMLKNNKNISVLTTYTDVDSIVSKTSSDSASSTLDRLQQNIYSQAGVSGQVFSSTGSSTLETAVKNDMALMMYLANNMATFITSLLNKEYGNNNLKFKYMILPISYYNEDKYVTNSFKLASSGYSFLVPAIAMGINQKDLVSLKDLENDILELDKKLIPLSSSYTQSSNDSNNNKENTEVKNEIGRPKKEQEDKQDNTIQKEESLDNQVGGK